MLWVMSYNDFSQYSLSPVRVVAGEEEEEVVVVVVVMLVVCSIVGPLLMKNNWLPTDGPTDRPTD